MPEDRILKRAAAYSVLLMACVLLIPFVLKLEKGKVTYAGVFPMLPTTISTMLPIGEKESLKYLSHQEDSDCKQNIKQQIPGGISENLKERLGNNFIVVEKPCHLSNSAMVELIDEAVDRKIRFIITDSYEIKIEDNQIHRMYQGNYYKGKPESEAPKATTVPENQKEQLVENQPLTSASAGKEKVDSVTSDNTKDTASNQASTTGSNESSPEKEESESITFTDCIKSIQINSYAYPDNESFKTEITLELDKTYAYVLFEDDHNYYISLVRPKDIYDKIIVVDAGHGGYDSGTYSRDFVYHEKDMNLSMVLELKKLLDKEDIKVYYTRTTDRGLTLNQRVTLANDVEADLFLSFHCNANEERGVHGTEVLYNEKQNDWTRMNSKSFATLCLEEVLNEIGLEDRGLVPRSKDVYIVGEANVPVALVEAAFMSNQGDLNFLASKDGKQKVAKGAYNAILSAYKELEQEDKGQKTVMR
ncbi:N-acetylmuramoyl-L-alanine amidase [Lachnoclostridium phytofermentans]|uniref:Cell wall hydrolase/autolysin n=1 Tax=Lachnoclostridium phytofermentans (strain ATCC 700394 / DSM 18823 / ISDg) TaxID=357809 RepID=A9KSW1_LACP7|nr:N-acetylmuramoyl-L-alanine amidase [Lachnoclostridium phytofermentans]ABX40755.1 cell wall hydrolase/autolysin [Lachnoclostridium phytofermentans ISDg]